MPVSARISILIILAVALTVEPVGVGVAAGVDEDTLFPLNGFRGLYQ